MFGNLYYWYYLYQQVYQYFFYILISIIGLISIVDVVLFPVGELLSLEYADIMVLLIGYDVKIFLDYLVS